MLKKPHKLIMGFWLQITKILSALAIELKALLFYGLIIYSDSRDWSLPVLTKA
jgi:hypothetical protein